MTEQRLYATVDRGNSRVKGVLWDGGRCTDRFDCLDSEKGRLVEWARGCGAEAAIVSSVAMPDSAFDRSLEEAFGCRVVFLNHRTRIPLKVAYSSPETLGMDRLAAAVGAAVRSPGSPLLVVDAGTAMTVDYVNASGAFAGGSIAPGVGMRLSSLSRHTSRLPQVSPSPVSGPVGSDTRSSLLQGCVAAPAYEIIGRVIAAPEELRPSRIYLTGGDAGLIAEELRRIGPPGLPETVTVPALVEEGLFEILRCNIADNA